MAVVTDHPEQAGTGRRDPQRAGCVPYIDAGAAMRDAVVAAGAAQPPLRPREWRVLTAVFALTASYSRLRDRASRGQVGELAGLSDTKQVARELASLRDRGLIVYIPGTGRGRLSIVGLSPAGESADSGGGDVPLTGFDPTERGVDTDPPSPVDNPSERGVSLDPPSPVDNGRKGGLLPAVKGVSQGRKGGSASTPHPRKPRDLDARAPATPPVGGAVSRRLHELAARSEQQLWPTPVEHHVDGRQDRSADNPTPQTPTTSGFAALPEGRKTGNALLDAVAGALPDQLAADLLADHRADTIAHRLDAIADVITPAAVVDHLTRRLPADTANVAAVLLSAPRLPHLERQAAQLHARASPTAPTVDDLIARGHDPAVAAELARREPA